MTADISVRSTESLLADLRNEGILTTTSLTLPSETTYEQWTAIGAMLGEAAKTTCWAVGDWLNFGDERFGEKAAQCMDATGLALQTISNYASVARRVPPSRRRASLPYSYHAVVAALEPGEQESWLKQAETEGWTRRELAVAVNGEPDDEVQLSCPTCNGKGWVTP